MGRVSLRDKLLDAGVAALHERGFAACGVREITRAAGVPLGSFTNHFRSKEEFAALVLDRYMDVLLRITAETLGDASREPVARIVGYFSAIEAIAAPLQWRWGCMLANLGLESPVHSEVLRVRLEKALADLTGFFTDAIREGQERGQVRTDLTPEDLGMIVLAGWHGVLLRAKVSRQGEAAALFARSVPLLLRAVS